MKLLITLSLILFLASCTITKRHFGRGYHIEWKSSASSGKSDSKIQDVDSTSNLTVETRTVESEKEAYLDFNSSSNNGIKEQTLVEQSSADDLELAQDEVTDPHVSANILEEKPVSQNGNDPADETMDSKKMEKSTWFSLLFFFLIGIMTAIFSISGFLLTVGAAAILFGLAIGMFITSLIAIIRILRNPDRYKNRVLSFTVFFFSCTFLAISFVAFVAIGLSEINFF